MPQLLFPPPGENEAEGDAGKTPTAGNPLGLTGKKGNGSPPVTGGDSRAFPLPLPGEQQQQDGGGGGLPLNTNIPPANEDDGDDGDDDDDDDDDGDDDWRIDRQSLRLASLEFMLSLSEGKPGMVKKVPGWTELLVRACLEGMAEVDVMEDGVSRFGSGQGKHGEEEGLREWLEEDVSLLPLSASIIFLCFMCYFLSSLESLDMISLFSFRFCWRCDRLGHSFNGVIFP
jgi:importin-5